MALVLSEKPKQAQLLPRYTCVQREKELLSKTNSPASRAYQANHWIKIKWQGSKDEVNDVGIFPLGALMRVQRDMYENSIVSCHSII